MGTAPPPAGGKPSANPAAGASPPAAAKTATTTAIPAGSAGGRVARWLLIGLELIIGASAVYGGVGLMLGGLGMPVEWLEGTPFDSWVLPGAFLLAVVSAPMLLAATGELAHRRWAYAASLAAGALQVGWILVQLAILQRYFFLQPVMAGAGVLVVGLAWWAHRGESVVGEPVVEVSRAGRRRARS